MAEQEIVEGRGTEDCRRKRRLSKEASRALIETICEGVFRSQPIREIIPATRRISKKHEGLWEYIRNEIHRRTSETYELRTLSSAWYYNLSKIGPCLKGTDVNDGKLVPRIEQLDTLHRYMIEHLGGRFSAPNELNDVEMDVDVKMPREQLLAISRQATINVHDISRHATLVVKNEQRSSGEDKKMDARMMRIERREEKKDEESTQSMNAVVDDAALTIRLADLFEPANSNPLVDNPTPSESIEKPPAPVIPFPSISRYNTALSHLAFGLSRNSSISGYDADVEPGMIKRRRKEIKKRVIVEEIKEEEEEVEENGEEEMDGGGGEEDGEEVIEEEEMDGEEEAVENPEEEEPEDKKKEIVSHLEAMINHLRDHIVTLRETGAIQDSEMNSLADSFDTARKTLLNNLSTV